MKYLNGNYYVEVKDHRYRIHPTENIILRERDLPKSLGFQYEPQNEIKIRRNQKVFRNINNELEVKNYPKNNQPIQQQKFKPPNCPNCKRNSWLENDEGYICKNCEHNINKQKHQIDKKVRRQDQCFSTRLPYADKKNREIYYSMVITTYNSTQEMIDKLQQLKGERELRFYKNINNSYDEMNFRRLSGTFQIEEDPFSKGVQSIGKFYHEVVLLKKFSQTKPQVKIINIKYYDLYYTVKKREEKEIVNNKKENNENDFNNFNNFITPNRFIEIKKDHVMLR